MQPGTPAALGEPSATPFNGLLTVLDPQHTVPAHSADAVPGTLPPALTAGALPYVPGVKVVQRHDALVLSFSNVAGAADYRAYVLGAGVTFATTPNGPQPRGAVIACAGYRQHTYQSAVKNGRHTRELLQTLELPGFVNAGSYTVVLEATASPCPFVGLPAHVDAQLTMDNNGTTNWFHMADPQTYRYSGIPLAVMTSFETAQQQFGNTILNGQGAAASWETRATNAFIGKAVSPSDPEILKDPAVLARTAIAVTFPAANEAETQPLVDVGPHALLDDFGIDKQVLPAAMTKNPDYAAYNNFSNNPLFALDTWQFWGRFVQGADAPGTATFADAMKGTQVFARHGRLYTTFGDSGQDVGGTLGFSSLVAPVVELDATKYVHSVFRINSEASHRRYWWWAMCGGATSAELFDSTAKRYKLRPLFFETSFGGGGNNPTVPDGHTLSTSSTPDDAVGVAKECLTFTEEARPENPFRTTGAAQTSAVLRAQLHPANKSHGIIGLGTAKSDQHVLNGQDTLGFRFKVDAAGNRVGPMLDPYDQVAPLTQYDVFVRPNRMVVYVNQRFGFCVDLSGRPLTMQYAMLAYGDLIYHSSVEWQELSDSASNENAQLYQAQLNAPIATSRIWDTIGHSDRVDLPASFEAFDAARCFPPATTAVQ